MNGLMDRIRDILQIASFVMAIVSGATLAFFAPMPPEPGPDMVLVAVKELVHAAAFMIGSALWLIVVFVASRLLRRAWVRFTRTMVAEYPTTGRSQEGSGHG